MTAQELRRWRIFARRHPFPAEILDTHLSVLGAMIANYMRGDGQAAYEASQFFVIRDPVLEVPRDDAPSDLSEAERMLAATGLR
jgi:hypothetical protein